MAISGNVCQDLRRLDDNWGDLARFKTIDAIRHDLAMFDNRWEDLTSDWIWQDSTRFGEIRRDVPGFGRISVVDIDRIWRDSARFRNTWQDREMFGELYNDLATFGGVDLGGGFRTIGRDSARFGQMWQDFTSSGEISPDLIWLDLERRGKIWGISHDLANLGKIRKYLAKSYNV